MLSIVTGQKAKCVGSNIRMTTEQDRNHTIVQTKRYELIQQTYPTKHSVMLTQSSNTYRPTHLSHTYFHTYFHALTTQSYNNFVLFLLRAIIISCSHRAAIIPSSLRATHTFHAHSHYTPNIRTTHLKRQTGLTEAAQHHNQSAENSRQLLPPCGENHVGKPFR